MKRFTLVTMSIALLFSAAAFAQSDNQSMSSVPSPKPSFKGFVSNGFWDNWEITLGGGTGAAIYNGRNYGKASDFFQGFGEVSVAKWLHPVVGARLQFQGGRYSTIANNQAYVKWPHLAVHVDGLINLSNWIGGYKEDRVYYAIPFAGMGVMATNFTEKSHRASGVNSAACNYIFAYGLQNRFRVTSFLDINLELRGLLGMSSLNPVRVTKRGNALHTANVSVGVTYRFGKRNFQRGAAGYSYSDIEALKRNAELALQEAEAAQAAKEATDERLSEAESALASAQQRAEKAESELNELKSRPVVIEETPSEIIFFGFAKYTLNYEACTRLDVLAKEINEGPADHIYKVTGYADFSTGSKSSNIAMAEKRAKAVYDYLIKAGVPADRLTYSGSSTGEQPFKFESNQAAIIR